MCTFEAFQPKGSSTFVGEHPLLQGTMAGGDGFLCDHFLDPRRKSPWGTLSPFWIGRRRGREATRDALSDGTFLTCFRADILCWIQGAWAASVKDQDSEFRFHKPAMAEQVGDTGRTPSEGERSDELRMDGRWNRHTIVGHPEKALHVRIFRWTAAN